jgi:hypothetical protein
MMLSSLSPGREYWGKIFYEATAIPNSKKDA